ncbi:hypothetical protein [Proteiniborus sp.]|uniref:hypothetical protein n=1 Tax=Proteiniborus sp. TaxID=2079015 RepID=UPI00332F7F04
MQLKVFPQEALANHLGISIRIPIPTPFIAGLGVIGFILGIVSFAKNKDRSILTILSILAGLLIIF